MEVVSSKERAGQTRRHILDVASRLFAEKGYAATSLNEIIGATRFTKGAFYFHFASKEALAHEVFRYKADEWTERVLFAAAQDAPAIDQIMAVAIALCDLHEEGDPAVGAIHRLAAESTDDPVLASNVASLFRMWIDAIASLIRRAQEEGDVRADVDPVAAAEAAVSGFVGIEQVAQALSVRADLRRRVESFFQLFLTAIRAERAPVKRKGLRAANRRPTAKGRRS